MEIHGRNLFAFLLHYVFTYGSMNPGIHNFNYNRCGWTQDPYDRWSWGTDNGQNVYFRLKSDDGQMHRACLESDPVEAISVQCLTFEYRTKYTYEHGGYSGALVVSLVYGDSEHRLVQVQEGKYDNVWQTFSLNIINVQSSMYVKIRFSASIARRNEINLGNIQLLNGSCRFECNFEENLCGTTIKSFQWTVYYGFPNTWSDHTSNEVGGHYLETGWINTAAALDNIYFLLYDIQCLTFWYRVSGPTSTVLVIVEDTAKKTNLSMWKTSRELNSTWLPATIDVAVFSRTMVEFRITGIPGIHPGRIGLDDITITSGSCIDCTFRDGFCNWDQSSDWKITRNGSIFASPECNVRNGSTLISRVEVFPGKKCLSLFHYIENNFITYIEVKFEDGVKWNQIWDNTREQQIRVWTTTHVNINLMNKSRIAIIVTHSPGCSDTYFIKSISMKHGPCKEPTTIHVPVSTFTTKYNSSYTSIKTTTTRKLTRATFSTADAPTITTTTNRTNEHDWENSGLQIKEDESSRQVSVGGIIGIIIGCVVVSGAATLVAVYVYRRRLASGTRTNTTRRRTLTNITKSGMLKRENQDKSITSSTEQNEKRNPMSESAYYNAQADYATVEKKRQRQNHNIHMSGSNNVSVYSLACSLPDKYYNSVSYAAKIDGINREDVNTENNYQYDTLYETRESLSDSTYNHTNELQDDAYTSTIPSAIRPLDETYDHPECKSTLDPIYNNTNVTNECTHNTTIKSSDQDFDHTYTNTCIVVYDDDGTVTHTKTKDADICDHIL